MSRVLVFSLREGWEASSIATTFVAASATKAMPTAIAEIFSIRVHPSEPHHRVPMFSVVAVFFDAGGHSHSAGVNSNPPRFIPESDVYWFTRYSQDLANATALKNKRCTKGRPVIGTALRFFQLFLPSFHR